MHLNPTPPGKRLALSLKQGWLLIALLALTARVRAAEEPPAREAPRFELKVKPESQEKAPGVFLMELKKEEGAADQGMVGEVVVWWMLPNGKKTTITMKQVLDNVWASRIALEAPPGRNQLAVVVLEKSKSGTVAKTTELDYEFVLPEMKLNLVESKPVKPQEKEVPATAALPHKVEPVPALPHKVEPVPTPAHGVKTDSWSLPVVVILVSVANLLLLLPGLLAFKFLGIASSIKGGGSLGDPATEQLFSKIFSGAGLIDRQTCSPLAWGPEYASDGPDEKPYFKEMFEKTITYPVDGISNVRKGSAGPASGAEIKKMSTEELLDTVNLTIEKIERKKQKSKSNKQNPVAENVTAAKEQDPVLKKSAPKPAAAKQTGAAESSERDLPLDLNNLSF